MDFKRFLLVLAIIGTLGFYLMQTSELSEGAQWGVVGILVAEFLLLLFMPGDQSQTVRRPANRSSSGAKSAVSDAESNDDDAVDVPEPVTEESLDGATLKQRKMAKIRAKEKEALALAAAEAEEDEDDLDPLPEIKVEVEEYHVAEEFVVEVNAQSVEDADIEDAVDLRRARHEKIRKRIADRRRSQMAAIRASTAKMWEDQDDSEDIIATLNNPQLKHGVEVIDEPAEVTAGHPYGSTFIRIDEDRILRLRTPLDSGFTSLVASDSSGLPPPDGLPALGDLPPPDGLPALGDLPPPVGLPPLGNLPPPPSPAQSALASLKTDMNDD